MKRILCIAFAAALFLALGFTAPDARADGHETYIHYLVVPSQAVDSMNQEEALEVLRMHLVEMAGGYTDLGPTQGGSLHGKKASLRDNRSFLVAADRNMAVELTRLVPTLFKTDKPFILVWKGEMYR